MLCPGLVFLFLTGLFVACAKGGGEERFTPTIEPAQASEDHEADLRRIMKRQMEEAARAGEGDRHAPIRRKPYFFKEYSRYTDPSDISVVLQKTESKSRPYVADVTVAKERFSTRLHRKRGEALRDEAFIRDSGTESNTYELRNTRWVRVGGVFIAEKTEENINGEWVPLREEVRRTVAAEERKGWFRRQWNKLTGNQ